MYYITLFNTLLITLFTSLLVNGLFILLNKLGALDWLRMRVENKFFSDMLNCYFCLSHHLSLIITIPILILDFQWLYLVIPLMVAGVIHLTK